MRRIQGEETGSPENYSAKRNAIVLAGLDLFTRYGYRKTSIDEIASTAQVAKRTVYLHFENKAAVFLAILEYLADQVRQRCYAAEQSGGTPVDRLTALLDASFGTGFELFSKSQHIPELAEASLELAQSRIAELNAEYKAFLVKFLRTLIKNGEIGGPPQGLTVEQIVRVLLRGAEASKYDPGIRGDLKAFQGRLRELATLAIAAMRK